MYRLWPVLVLLLPAPLASQASDAALQQGRRIFEGNCVRCHGMGGTGGEGPTLARPFLARARDDQALASVIRRGIRGTGMPGVWRMSDNEVRALVTYVRSLGRVRPEAVAGDADRGKRLFETKGECADCHTIGTYGSNLGPDLSRVLQAGCLRTRVGEETRAPRRPGSAETERHGRTPDLSRIATRQAKLTTLKV